MKDGTQKPLSLADGTVLYAQYLKAKSSTVGLDNVEMMNGIAHQLPAMKHILWDDRIIHAVDKTGKIDTEEMVGQLEHASFPFGRFWIEGPSFLDFGRHNIRHPLDPSLPRLGMLVIADSDKHEFKFKLVKELMHMDFVYSSHGVNLPSDHFLRRTGGAIADCMFRDFVTVSPAGIDLNEDVLLDALSDKGKKTERLNRELEGSLRGHVVRDVKIARDEAETINDLYSAADFLTRFFVLLGSKKIGNNLEQVKQEQSVDLSKINKKRESSGKLPLMPLSPIHIDISPENTKVLESGHIKQIRQLLGWTSVRRSRPIISKYGVEFTRKAHDRRIAADVDRRNIVREVTASKPIEFAVEAGRPVVRAAGDAPSTPSPPA